MTRTPNQEADKFAFLNPIAERIATSLTETEVEGFRAALAYHRHYVATCQNTRTPEKEQG